MSALHAFIQQIHDALPLSQVLGQFVALKRHGSEFQACCPFHKEKTPSFTVNNQKNFYHCFGCGAHGDALSFLQSHSGLSFMEALEQLANMAGLEVPQTTPISPYIEKARQAQHAILEETARFFERTLLSQNNALKYLEKRGVSKVLQKKYRLGFATPALLKHLYDQGFSVQSMVKAGIAFALHGEKDKTQAFEHHASQNTSSNLDENAQSSSLKLSDVKARFRQRLMIPIMDKKGEVIAFGGRTFEKDVQPKYLNSPETDLFQKKRTLFGLNFIKKTSKEQPIIVVEGYFDVIMLQHAGFNAVAPLGTALTEDHLRLLWRFGATPIICFDGDNAGQSAMIRTAKNALAHIQPGYSLQFMSLPFGDDPDSFVQQKGAHAFDALIEKSHSLVDVICRHYLSSMTHQPPEIKARVKQEALKTFDDIQDKDVKSFYKQAFYDALKSLHTPTAFVSRAIQEKKTNHQGAFSPPRSISAPLPAMAHAHTIEVLEKILLATLMNHPTLVPKLGEHAAGTPWEVKGAHALLNDIMDGWAAYDQTLLQNAQMAPQNAATDVSMCGFSFDATMITDHDARALFENIVQDAHLEKRAPFIAPQTDDHVATGGFMAIWDLHYKKTTLARTIADYKHSLTQTWNPKIWQALQKLQLDFYALSTTKEAL